LLDFEPLLAKPGIGSLLGRERLRCGQTFTIEGTGPAIDQREAS
jgi:hypothetical protein